MSDRIVFGQYRSKEEDEKYYKLLGITREEESSENEVRQQYSEEVVASLKEEIQTSPSVEESAVVEEAPEESTESKSSGEIADLEQLTRDELVELAKRYGVEYYRVRTDVLISRLKEVLNK